MWSLETLLKSPILYFFDEVGRSLKVSDRSGETNQSLTLHWSGLCNTLDDWSGHIVFNHVTPYLLRVWTSGLTSKNRDDL